MKINIKGVKCPECVGTMSVYVNESSTMLYCKSCEYNVSLTKPSCFGDYQDSCGIPGSACPKQTRELCRAVTKPAKAKDEGTGGLF